MRCKAVIARKLIASMFCLYLPVSAESQAVFNIPSQVNAFTEYITPMHCESLGKRLNTHLMIRQDSLSIANRVLQGMKGVRPSISSPDVYTIASNLRSQDKKATQYQLQHPPELKGTLMPLW